MGLFSWKGKELKMVWRVEKEGKTSFLVGTSHFFRHSFRRALTRLIQGAENVLFEGPLDDESMARVAAYGRQAEGSPSLLEALDPKVIREINRQMNNWGSPIKRHLSREKSIPTVREYLLPLPSFVSEWMKQINRVIPISSFAVFSFEFAVSVLTAPVTHQALDLQKNEIFSSAIPVPFHGTQKIFGSRPCPKGGLQILWLLANPAFGGTHGVGGQDIDDLLGSG